MDRACIKAEHPGRGWHPWSRTSFQRKLRNCSSVSRTDSQSAELSHPSEEEVCSQSAMVVLLNPPNTPSSKNFTSSGKGCPGARPSAPNNSPNGRRLCLLPGPRWFLHPGCISSLRGLASESSLVFPGDSFSVCRLSQLQLVYFFSHCLCGSHSRFRKSLEISCVGLVEVTKWRRNSQ